MVSILLLAALTLQNVQLTPGVVNYKISVKQICSTAWGKDVRHVSEADKQFVAYLYNVPQEDWAEYEFDHLIPRELGGADDTSNLWPQPIWEAKHLKDPLETRLRKLVCAGKLDLGTAQAEISSDWRKLSAKYPNKKTSK